MPFIDPIKIGITHFIYPYTNYCFQTVNSRGQTRHSEIHYQELEKKDKTGGEKDMYTTLTHQPEYVSGETVKVV